MMHGHGHRKMGILKKWGHGHEEGHATYKFIYL